MFFLTGLLIALTATGLVVYFDQYLKDGIVYWSIIPLILAFFLAFIVAYILIAYVLGLLIRPDKELSRPRTFHRYVIKAITEFLTDLGRIKFTTIGYEKLSNFDKYPHTQKFLLVCNHQSNFDPIISVWALRKLRIAYIMKDSILKVPIIGRWLYGAGFLPLDRNNNRKAIETIQIATKRIANGLHPIAVYPEGTRSKGPHMNEFRNGVFRIAQKAKCPIVVMVIDNTYRVKYRFPFRSTKVLLEIIDVIPYEKFEGKSTNEIGDAIRDQMIDRLEQRRNEFEWLKIKKA